ncbi:acetoin dehydrogenase dihydrolipoyllysine-residue acetyltransferase subunit [Aureimonas flava]|uniref:Acetoin dehydrogenase dihydrolipoyllysine-residue acetyltransferase subunit n=1 Tax=Aureimonas flava TaxID=2320271 RepID=A0A3A1WL62_9HYPH|nr:acetoin dehydrogenase dihydrolipoyllysine-residue acetyltransferase subunit [Aureimonas flava]RIY02039.1 acetoin dehydrogenase dihydrolipoyllysine-residue acetyltransferase subunit [Aureimonas flava]
MPTEVILPKVDMDMATGQISRWFYKEGDAIRKGEPLFEIETDKAAMEVDAPASGTLRNVTGAEGVDIAVGAPVAWIYAEGEAFDPASAPGRVPVEVGPDPDVETDAAPVSADAVATPANGLVGKTCCAQPGGERRGVRATPLARRIARERGVDLATVTGTGPLGRIGRDDVERAATAEAASAPAGGSQVRAEPQPLARAPDSGPASRVSAPAAEADTPLAVVRLREGAGVPVVLIHGFGSESASWRPLLSEMGEGGAVLGIDLAGHGASLDREADGFAALVAGVEETLLALGLASCHLVGHSLGGAVATAVASGTASDVRSLMLLSPAGFGPDIDTGFTEGFARATQEAPVRAWLRHLVADPATLSDGFVRATARGRADGRQAEAQARLGTRLFSNGTQHLSVRDLAAGLSMPVKIVAGAEDRVVPARHFAGLPGRIALHVFPRTGHMPQIEQKGDVARLLRELTR